MLQGNAWTRSTALGILALLYWKQSFRSCLNEALTVDCNKAVKAFAVITSTRTLTMGTLSPSCSTGFFCCCPAGPHGNPFPSEARLAYSLQYRLKSYAHWHAWTTRAERVYCMREEQDETRAVHERKPRFKIYLDQKDEMATQKDRVGYCVFIVFLWMDFFSHWQLANSETIMQISLNRFLWDCRSI